MSKSVRITNLDVFRFFAIVSVVYYHVSLMFLAPYFKSESFYMIGELGVELFFVLSGFLVSGLYYKAKSTHINVNLRVFWLRRFLRTYPPYLIAFFVSFGLVFFFKNEPFDYGYLVFLQNFYDEIKFFKISWSLCVEEHFYLLFVLFILITNKFSKKSEMLSWILWCIVPLLFRLILGYNNTPQTFNFYVTATIFKMDGIAMGGFLAYLVNHYNISYKGKFINNTCLLISLIFIGLWISKDYNYLKYTVGYFLFVLNATLLMGSLYFSRPVRLGKIPYVKHIALMAYSIYLTHAWVINLFIMLQGKYDMNVFIMVLICLILILIVAKIFYWLIEKQAILLRNRLLH